MSPTVTVPKALNVSGEHVIPQTARQARNLKDSAKWLAAEEEEMESINHNKEELLGNVIYMNGDLVGWYTHKQPIVATSSTEAEYVAVSDACKDGLSLYYFLGEFVQVLTPITIYMDNQGAMFMASNLVTNKRSKHIDLRYHMIRDYINKGIFRLEYISTDKNIADIMTKG
eukprot:CAMPEP_0114270248 /NCGR_PEP_ID=MMETSP0058-20121206/27125_1 /TAXON_ID=36894 /ORGANISM="Pyramimonas parkeae, CCMP726" /LENGTH=170 /DNA_ID=CAMNT_0001388949 /DNA_START=1089 /DNA_END=1599 /DNA_ORIENTATION=+